MRDPGSESSYLESVLPVEKTSLSVPHAAIEYL